MSKLRVGVLMGGKSIEHEVSFNSGRTICDHLDTKRYEIIPLYQSLDGALYILPWHFLHRGKTTDFIHRLSKEAQVLAIDELPTIIDFMYIATHGRFAEDGTLQGMLEILSIPYLGTKVFGSALGLDKIQQKNVLRQHNIPVPKDCIISPTHIVQFESEKENVIQQLHDASIQFPVVVKPYKEGSSLGISVVFDSKDLQSALETACFAHHGKAQSVLIEEKIEGMEFTCIIITDHKNNKLIPLPITEVIPETNTHFFDYEQKYMPGRATKFTPARCSKTVMKHIQDVCLETMHALEFENMARIDGFYTKNNEVVIIDPNTLSGMGPATFLFKQAAHVGMSHTRLINHLIETELDHYGMLQKLEDVIKNKTEESTMRKIDIAVLLGGASNEKEISLESGRNVVYKLSPHKYNPIPLFVNKDLQLYRLTQEQLVHHSTQAIEESLQPDQHIQWNDLPSIVDFVFIGLHGGIGENGSVQGMLEMLDLPYNGSGVLTSSLCMNKYKTNRLLKSKGFNVPQSFLITQDRWKKNNELLTTINQTFTFPLIAKPSDDGCSVGVHKIMTNDELNVIIDQLFAEGKTEVMLEECISGMELTVGVVGNDDPKALVPSQAVTSGNILSIEEKFLPGLGENQTPAPLPEKTIELIQRTIENVYKTVSCKGYARIDCFYQTAQESPTKKERVIIIEINTLPGLTPATCIFHQAAELGIKPMDFIDTIIELGFEEHQKTVVGEQSVSKTLSLE